MGRQGFLFAIVIFMSLVTMAVQGQQSEAPLLATAVSDFGSELTMCPAPFQPVNLQNPTIITDCTGAGLQAALDHGGHVAFDCGPDPVSIPINQTLVVTQDVVLDGGNLVTLDGQNQVKILEKPWTPAPVSLTVQHLRFANGRAPSSSDLSENSGSAITLGHPGSRLHVLNSTFENNHTTSVTQSDNQGGAIFVSNAYETVIVGSQFTNNSAGNGGAFGGIATGLVIYNSRFSGNQAVDTTSGGIVRGYGGAIHLDGVRNSYNPNSNKTVDVCGSIFENNQAVRGGGAFSSVVSDNYGTKATFARSTFANNEVTGLNGEYGQGGAIYHIEDDHADGRGEDNLEIANSTFQGNLALRQGGAVWLLVLGNGRIINSTFAGNSTTAPFNTVGQGGAAMVSLGHIEIVNTTFAHNHAAYQAGALHAGSATNPDRVVTLRNTIFLDNTLNEQDLPSETRWQGYHTNRPMVDGGQNIQQPRYKPTYNNDVNNNIVPAPLYVDPLLAPLANNGGYNDTMALQPGSPAIDAGAAGCPANDQRFAPRVGPCDIGPYEFGGVPPISNRLRLDVQVSDLNGALPYSQTVAYELTLVNGDTAPVSGVTLAATLPTAVSFAYWVQQSGAALVGDTVAWGPGVLAAGEALRVIFTTDINAPAGTVITVTAVFHTNNGETGSDTATFTAGQRPSWRSYLPLLMR